MAPRRLGQARHAARRGACASVRAKRVGVEDCVGGARSGAAFNPPFEARVSLQAEAYTSSAARRLR